MTRRARFVLFAAGLVLYAVIIRATGVAALVEHLRQSGWTLFAVIGVYAAVYACNTLAWQCILAGEPKRPGFAKSYSITTASFAINYITPIVNAGGEPYR